METIAEREKKKGKKKKKTSDLFLQQICEYQYDEFLKIYQETLLINGNSKTLKKLTNRI